MGGKLHLPIMWWNRVGEVAVNDSDAGFARQSHIGFQAIMAGESKPSLLEEKAITSENKVLRYKIN